MFSLFPCDWSQPKPKWLFASGQPIGNPVFIKRPDIPKIKVPQVPVKGEALNKGFADNDLVDEVMTLFKKGVIPLEEMCLGESVDTSEIDQMLAEMGDDSRDGKTRQIMRMIAVVNENLDKNIKIIQNAPAGDGDLISREDLLKLLQMFANYSHSVENYLKEIAVANCRKHDG